jgi:outer membrane receptor for monomeric catechols
MAVDVITAEEIRASGATNIADLLRFRVGMETYTYEHVSDWIGDQGSITQNTPAHKVNLGAIADLGHGFSGSMNVGYKDNYFITSVGRSLSAAIAAYWRLDARLAYALNVRTELFLACQNLAADTHVEFADGLTVPRTYQGGMTLKWGGGS